MSGMRISELARLRWEDLDLDRGTVLIKKQKSRKISSIPLSETAIHLLKEVKRQNSCPFVFASPRLRSSERSTHAFCNRVSKSFAKYRIKARIIEKKTFHSLRHGFCTALAESGTSACNSICRPAQLDYYVTAIRESLSGSCTSRPQFYVQKRF